ncbi:DNA translocase FtsK [Kurthia zopfii]|uniref:DNA translocase FtsK n=1 Tax=Kurthia zopfii TaxID=1650 RepID=UPI000F71CE18|nr:DNA translocase FtsK [Kurthia zopfii]VEI08469.1 Septum-associated FtsK-like translocase of DNA [Kurthia zopfii]
MSWIKNLFNKIISDEEENDNNTKKQHKQFDEQYEYEENEYYEEEMNEEPKQEKKFNFPLIEEQPAENAEPIGDTPLKMNYPEVEEVNKNAYAPFGSSRAGGSPVQGIARNQYNPFGGSPAVKTKAKEPVISKQKPKYNEKMKEVKVEEKKVYQPEPIAKPKFVPTEVPSPVFGLKKAKLHADVQHESQKNALPETSKVKGTLAEQLIHERKLREQRIFGDSDVEVNVLEQPVHKAPTMTESNSPKEQSEPQLQVAVAEPIVEPELVEEEPAPVVEAAQVEAETAPVVETEIVEVEAAPVMETAQVEEEPAPIVEAEQVEEEPAPVIGTELVEEEPAPVVEAAQVEAETAPVVETEIVEVEAAPVMETAQVEEEPAPIVEAEQVEEEPAPVIGTELVEEEPAPVVETEIVEAEAAPVVEAEQVEAETAPVIGTEQVVADRRVSRTPINVVMLKSDKEKLNATPSTPKSNLEFPDWKKNPLKVMQNYRATPTTIKKETAENNSADEVTPTEPQFVNELSEEQIVMDIPTEVEVKPAHWDSYKETLAVLREPEEEQQDLEWMESQGELLVEVLAEFNVQAEIVDIVQGPAVTQFEITVGHGVKISKIKNLSDNLKLALAARDIRIEAPIPGKRSIGIEIPNATSRPVRLSEIVGTNNFKDSENLLEVALGLDITGKPVTFDLANMPHGLIAGATGSGKSVCINSLLVSLLMKASPNDVKLLLIDPKMVELAVYDELPHLVSPVITDVKAATAALKWAVEEMERRYQLFHHMKVRHISRYNEIVEEQRKYSLKMPYLVIVIDELADLMMMAPADVEESICRIAQKARACGIHLVLATQRPSVDVITGLIKSNIPTRIAFAVSSQIDSRTIIDSQGAERLLGRGDMLYLGYGKSAPVRLQGTFVTDQEIEQVTNHIRSLGKPSYAFAPEELVQKVEQAEEQDELFEEVCRSAAEESSISISAIQRKYRIGYNRAARLVEMMDSHGFISESKGSKPRDVFLTPEKADEIFQ